MISPEYDVQPELIKNTIGPETFKSLRARGWIALNDSHEIYVTSEGQKVIQRILKDAEERLGQ